MKLKTGLTILIIISFSFGSYAQKTPQGNVHADKNGVMRWKMAMRLKASE